MILGEALLRNPTRYDIPEIMEPTKTYTPLDGNYWVNASLQLATINLAWEGVYGAALSQLIRIIQATEYVPLYWTVPIPVTNISRTRLYRWFYFDDEGLLGISGKVIIVDFDISPLPGTGNIIVDSSSSSLISLAANVSMTLKLGNFV